MTARSSVRMRARARGVRSAYGACSSLSQARSSAKGRKPRKVSRPCSSPIFALIGVPVATHAWRRQSCEHMSAACELVFSTSCASSSTTRQKPSDAKRPSSERFTSSRSASYEHSTTWQSSTGGAAPPLGPTNRTPRCVAARTSMSPVSAAASRSASAAANASGPSPPSVPTLYFGAGLRARFGLLASSACDAASARSAAAMPCTLSWWRAAELSRATVQ
mmetsp:Transcript_22889/g.52802  ORF Transcript_22889/g.52802 Transcript_22889/m.52802 type:complete len:220 (+) Transcript_22889:309-968(+)